MVDLHIYSEKSNYFHSKVWLICLPARTSACIFKDTLWNHTQVFFKFRDSILEICLHLINLNCTLDFLHSMMLSSGAGTSNEIPLQESWFVLPAILITLPIFIYWNQLLWSDNLIFKFYNPQGGIYFITEFDWLWCFLCGTIIQWPKHTQTEYANCFQFHRDIRWRYPRNDLYIISCIARTTDCDNRWRLKWAHNAIWFWTAVSNCSPMPDRLEPSAQFFKFPSNDGNGK